MQTHPCSLMHSVRARDKQGGRRRWAGGRGGCKCCLCWCVVPVGAPFSDRDIPGGFPSRPRADSDEYGTSALHPPPLVGIDSLQPSTGEDSWLPGHFDDDHLGVGVGVGVGVGPLMPGTSQEPGPWDFSLHPDQDHHDPFSPSFTPGGACHPCTKDAKCGRSMSDSMHDTPFYSRSRSPSPSPHHNHTPREECSPSSSATSSFSSRLTNLPPRGVSDYHLMDDGGCGGQHDLSSCEIRRHTSLPVDSMAMADALYLAGDKRPPNRHVSASEQQAPPHCVWGERDGSSSFGGVKNWSPGMPPGSPYSFSSPLKGGEEGQPDTEWKGEARRGEKRGACALTIEWPCGVFMWCVQGAWRSGLTPTTCQSNSSTDGERAPVFLPGITALTFRFPLVLSQGPLILPHWWRLTHQVPAPKASPVQTAVIQATQHRHGSRHTAATPLIQEAQAEAPRHPHRCAPAVCGAEGQHHSSQCGRGDGDCPVGRDGGRDAAAGDQTACA